MSLNKIPALKVAVLQLPEKEKDKLLVRLINKDNMLIKQLHFQLLESEEDLAARNETLKEELNRLFDLSANYVRRSYDYANYKELMYFLKAASGLVNEHEKVTKDKIGVLEARILIVINTIERYGELFSKDFDLYGYGYNLKKYFKGRIKLIVTALAKLHEDIQFDFRDQLEQMLTFSEENKLENY